MHSGRLGRPERALGAGSVGSCSTRGLSSAFLLAGLEPGSRLVIPLRDTLAPLPSVIEDVPLQILMFQPASAPPPGVSPPAQQPAAPPPTSSVAPAPDPGAAPAPSGGAWGGTMMLVLPFLLLFGLLFLMNRGEKKKRAALESKLKRGDRVVTRSGIKGKLIDIGEGTAKVEIAPGVNVVMVKAAIEGLDPGESAAAAGKALDDKALDGKDRKK